MWQWNCHFLNRQLENLKGYPETGRQVFVWEESRSLRFQMLWVITCNGWHAGNITGGSVGCTKNSVSGILERNVRICKLNMRRANGLTGSHETLNVWHRKAWHRDMSSSQNKWNCPPISPLKHRNCNILVRVYKLLYTWTHAEPTIFCPISLFVAFLLLREDSIGKETVLPVCHFKNIWRILKKQIYQMFINI